MDVPTPSTLTGHRSWPLVGSRGNCAMPEHLEHFILSPWSGIFHFLVAAEQSDNAAMAKREQLNVHYSTCSVFILQFPLFVHLIGIKYLWFYPSRKSFQFPVVLCMKGSRYLKRLLCFAHLTNLAQKGQTIPRPFGLPLLHTASTTI